MTRQVTDQQYIDLDYYTPEDYFVYTAVADAVLSSEFKLGHITGGVLDLGTAEVSVIADATSTVSSESTLACAAATTAQGIAAVSSESSVTCAADKIKSATVAVSSEFSLSVTALSDQFYIDEDYFEEGYFVYTAEAVSVQQTQASLSVVAGRLESVAITINSEFSLLSAADKIKSVAATISSEFTLACAAVRSRDNAVISECVSSLTCAAVGIRDAAVSLTAEGSLTCAAGRIITAESIQLTVAGVSLEATVTSSASTDLSSTAVLTSQGVVERSANVTLSTLVTLSLQGDRTRDNSVPLSTEFSTTSNAVATLSGSTAFVVNSTVTADVDRFRLASNDLAAASSLAADANIIKDNPVALSSNVQLQSTVNVTAVANLQAQSNAILAANGTVIRAAAAAFSSTATVTANNTRFRNLDAAVAGEFTQIANINKLTGYASTLSAAVTVTTQANRFRAVDSLLISTVTVEATGIRPVFYSADLVSTATLQVRKRYWIAAISSDLTTNTMLSGAISVDNQLNVYNSTNDATNKFITRLDKNANIDWSIYQSTHTVVTNKIGPDNLLYAVLRSGDVNSIAKFNSVGAMTLARTLPGTIVDFDFDSEGNIWALASFTVTEVFLGTPRTVTKGRLYKVNSAGNIVYQARVLDIFTDGNNTPNVIKVESNSIYIAGTISIGFQIQTVVAKYQLSDPVTVRVVRFNLSESQLGTTPTGIDAEADGAVYVTTSNSLLRFTRDLSFQWARRFKENPSTNDVVTTVRVDRFDNIVVKQNRIFLLDPGFYNINQVYIFNVSGGIQHQYQLNYFEPGNTIGGLLELDDLRNIYISGLDTVKGGFIAKLPPDALGLGEYEDWYYSTTAVTPINFTISSLLQNTFASTETLGSASDLSLTWLYQSSFNEEVVDFFIDGVDVIVNLASLRAESSLICQTTVNKQSSVNLVSQSTLIATDTDFTKASADLQVVGSKLTVAVKTGRTLVTMECNSTVVVSARKDVVASSALNSISTVTATARKDVESAVTLAVNTALLCDFDRIRPGSAEFNSTVTFNSTVIKTVRVNSNLSSTAELTADATITLAGAILLTSESTLSAAAIATLRGSSNLQVQSTQVSNANRLVGFECDMSAFNFVLAIGRKLVIDPYYQLTVPRELRHKAIAQETRILSIDSENRLNTIQAQNRLLMVPSETRVWHIPYSPQQGTRRVK
jgi:hypothetical protein